MLIRHGSFVLFSLFAFACSSSDDKVDIGDRNVDSLGSKLEDFSGSWDGYAEAYTFGNPADSDRIRVSIDANGEGTVRFGDATLAGSPEPFVPFPPETSVSPSIDGSLPSPGFDYPIRTATLESTRLRFTLESGDVVGDWCALQPSAPDDRPFHDPYTCFGSAPFVGNEDQTVGSCIYEDPTTHEQTPFECLADANCLASCDCTASGCTAKELGTVSFDAALESTTRLVGTLTFPTSSSGSARLTVRFSRAE
jgi:hypothetical protein